MLKDYVLGAEIAEKGDFHIANISMLFNDLPLIEGTDFLKFGGITLLSKKSLKFPKYIQAIMFRKDMTDLSELLPASYFKETLENNLDMIQDKYLNIKVCSKQFVEITDEELYKIFMNIELVKGIVKLSEIGELLKDDLIKGYLQVANKKCLIWY